MGRSGPIERSQPIEIGLEVATEHHVYKRIERVRSEVAALAALVGPQSDLAGECAVDALEAIEDVREAWLVAFTKPPD